MTLNANPPIPLMEAASIASSAYGKFTGDGSGLLNMPVGFSPIKVRVYNITDGLIWDWMAGMDATKSLLTTMSTGVVTVDSSSAIISNHVLTTNTVNAQYVPSGNGAGTGTLGPTSLQVDAPDQTLQKLIFSSAALNINAKSYAWEAFG